MQSYRMAVRARTTTRCFRSAILPSVTRVTSVRYASQDYGSGEGNPAGENPQEQGAHKGSDLEHPGPPPPDVGQKGAGATSHTQDSGSTTSDNSPSGSSSSSQSSQTSSGGSSGNGASPKINTQPPDQSGDDVKKHNEGMDNLQKQRDGRAEDETVGKGFWSGQGGADRQP